jgi:hypothetical protein
MKNLQTYINRHQQPDPVLDRSDLLKFRRKLSFVIAYWLGPASQGQYNISASNAPKESQKSIAKELIIIMALIVSRAAAQAYTSDSKKYQDAMTQYGKEIFAASFTENLCSKKSVERFNEVYFRAGPPRLWHDDVYQKFM